MDLGLGADIDAARRLVEKDHLGVDREHLGDGHLLLVAARQVRDRLVDAAMFQVEPGAEALGLGCFAAIVDDAGGAGDLPQPQCRDIGSDRHVEKQAVALAVLAEIDKARGDAVAVIVQGQRLAGQPDVTGHLAVEAADALDDFAAPGPDQAGKPEDLAAVQLERDVLEASGFAQALHLEKDLVRTRLRRLLGRIELVNDPADHGTDHRTRRRFGDIEGGDVLAVAEDADPVAIVENLDHAVRDIDDRDALGGQPAHDAEQDPGLALGQRGRRFVQDQHPALERQRLGDLDQLLLRDRQVSHHGRGVDIAQLAQTAPSAEPASGIQRAASSGLACRIEAVAR